MRFFQQYGTFAIGVLISFVVTLYVSSFPFFWDTIQLGSKHANWFYTQGLHGFLLPNSLDSGHCPIFGLYLAAVWIVFGKTLVVSHFAMLPFLITIVYFFLSIGRHLTDRRFSGFFLLLLFCNPYFLGQVILVSPDIVLLAFMLMCIDAALRLNRWQLLFGAIGLSLISQRGLIVLCALGVWIIIIDYLDSNKTAIAKIKFIIPGLLLASAYQLYHYLSKGWLGYHDGSPWADSFQTVDSMYKLVKQGGIFIWRLGDHGNFAIWIGLIAVAARGRLRDSKIIVLLVLLVLAFAFVIIPKVGLLNHRYFLPIIVVATIVLLEMLYKSSIRYKRQFIYGLGLILITGNLWTYPEGVAQGWDSTLSHVPYYELFDDALIYINDHNIAIDEVGSAFPANNKISDIYLNGIDLAFKPFNLESDKYILYATIMNDFESEHLFELDNLWKPIFKKEKGNINIILFERK